MYVNAIIVCTNKPGGTIARYCWLTNRSSPRRFLLILAAWTWSTEDNSLFQGGRGDCSNVNITNLPSILGMRC